jgi:crossover junction endodeoxyribonuclease RuvC
MRTRPQEKFSRRLLMISDGLQEVIERCAPEICAVEEAFFAVNVKTALKLGQVRGAIMLTAERAGLSVFEYAPRLVKSTVVGYGAAEKHQVGEMVRLLLNLKDVPQPNDASDALAIAICHLHHAGGRGNAVTQIKPRPSRRATRLTATELATALRRRAAR